MSKEERTTLDIIEQYNNLRAIREMEMDELESKELEKRRKASRLVAQADKLRKKRDEIYFGFNWIDGIVKPLAKELADRTGLGYEIFGPFGLRSQTTIYLRADMSRSITQQETRHISLVPMTLEGAETVYYETGEQTDEYSEGSLGYLNGMNNKLAPLPDTIEEVEQLLR